MEKHLPRVKQWFFDLGLGWPGWARDVREVTKKVLYV